MNSAIQVCGLKKSYGRHMVLNGLDFEIEKGETFALLGVNGAGKTTALVAEEIFCDDESRLQMMQRVLKGRMLPLLVIFFATLLPQFLINLLSTHNYFIAAFVGAVLAMYIGIFAMCFVKYNQYKNNKK